MSKQLSGRGPKYTDEFKRQLAAESHGDGVSVPMVSRRHGCRRTGFTRGAAMRGSSRRRLMIPGSYQSGLMAALTMRRLCSPQRSQRAFRHP